MLTSIWFLRLISQSLLPTLKVGPPSVDLEF